MGGMMRGALIETEVRTISNRGKDEAKKEIALRMLWDEEYRLIRSRNIPG